MPLEIPWTMSQAHPTTFKEDWKGHTLINSINGKKNHSCNVSISMQGLKQPWRLLYSD